MGQEFNVPAQIRSPESDEENCWLPLPLGSMDFEMKCQQSHFSDSSHFSRADDVNNNHRTGCFHNTVISPSFERVRQCGEKIGAKPANLLLNVEPINVKSTSSQLGFDEQLSPTETSRFQKLESWYIDYLISITSVKSRDKNSLHIIKDYYKKLDSIPEVSIILKLMKFSDAVIVFDYSKEVSVTALIEERANGKRNIHIPGLSEEDDILRELAHGMTNVAMEIVFDNKCNPYYRSEEDGRLCLEAIVQQVVKSSRKIRYMLLGRGCNLSAGIQHSKLIARVPEILAEYENGREWLEKNAPNLLQFYIERVVPKCRDYIKQHLQSICDKEPTNLIVQLNEKLGETGKLENIVFENTSFITKILNRLDEQILIFKTSNTLLGVIAIQQGFFGKNYMTFSDRYMALDPETYLREKVEINHALDSEDLNVLVLRFKRKEWDERTIQIVYDILQKKPNLKIVLVVDYLIAEKVRVIFTDKLIKFTQVSGEELSLSDLTKKSKEKILAREINFQQKKMKLSDLIGSDENLHKHINGDIMENILEGNTVHIENTVNQFIANSPLQPLQESYLRRDFLKVVVNESEVENMIRDNPSEYFIFSDEDDATDLEIESYQNVRITDKVYVSDYFKKFSDRKKPIHWFHIDDHKIFWKESTESVKSLRKYIRYDDQYEFKENDLAEELKNKKTFIISDVAGTGKSTTLNALLKVKSIIEEHWIIKINLGSVKYIRGNYTGFPLKYLIQELQNMKPNLGRKLTEKLLEKALNPEIKFPKRLLFVFDGFDEISNEDLRQKFLIFLIYLTRTTNCRIWVTTSPQYKEDLEDILFTFSLKFKTENDESIITYTQEFFKNQLNLTLDTNQNSSTPKKCSKTYLYAEKCLNASRLIFKDETRLIGMPLQLKLTLQNSVEHFKKWTENCANFAYFDFDHLGKNILEIYEKFIDRKYEIYFKNLNMTECEQVEIKSLLENFYRDLARSMILDDLMPFQNLKGRKAQGISMNMILPEKRSIMFVHSSFRDYYFARFIINLLTNNFMNVNMEIMTKLTKIFFEEQYRLIRRFINFQLQKIGVFELPEIKISEIMEAPTAVKILSVALSESNLQILDLILLNGQNATTTWLYKLLTSEIDNQLTVISYLISTGRLEILKIYYIKIKELMIKENKQRMSSKNDENYLAVKPFKNQAKISFDWEDFVRICAMPKGQDFPLERPINIPRKQIEFESISLVASHAKPQDLIKASLQHLKLDFLCLLCIIFYSYMFLVTLPTLGPGENFLHKPDGI